jgi:hypothetical protein
MMKRRFFIQIFLDRASSTASEMTNLSQATASLPIDITVRGSVCRTGMTIASCSSSGQGGDRDIEDNTFM